MTDHNTLTDQWTETRRQQVDGMLQVFGESSFCLMYRVDEMRKVNGAIESRSRFLRGDKTYQLRDVISDPKSQALFGEMELALFTAQAAITSLERIAAEVDRESA